MVPVLLAIVNLARFPGQRVQLPVDIAIGCEGKITHRHQARAETDSSHGLNEVTAPLIFYELLSWIAAQFFIFIE